MWRELYITWFQKSVLSYIMSGFLMILLHVISNTLWEMAGFPLIKNSSLRVLGIQTSSNISSFWSFVSGTLLEQVYSNKIILNCFLRFLVLFFSSFLNVPGILHKQSITLSWAMQNASSSWKWKGKMHRSLRVAVNFS